MDLGAAPGGWAQVLARRVGREGRIVAVDLLPMREIPGVAVVCGDFLQECVRQQVMTLLGNGCDVVTSDMSPNITGIRITDQERGATLGMAAIAFARQVLRAKGRMILKAFESERRDDLRASLQESFKTVKICRPQATRANSREFYFVASGFRQPSVTRRAD